MAAPWYDLALQDWGKVKEVSGSGDNPKIVAYYKDAGSPGITEDSVPWCAAFVGAMLYRAGYPNSGSLRARSYLAYGKSVTKPELGDIVVFKRGAPPSGHVAFFIEDVGDKVRVLGGNQSDAVTKALYPKTAVLGYRRPIEKVQPKPVPAETETEADVAIQIPQNVVTVRDQLVSMGWHKHEADGIAGHIMQESGGNPLAEAENEGAFGLCQWRGSRLTELKNYAARIGTGQYTHLAVQARFIDYELNTTEKAAANLLRQTITVEEAVLAFMRFERPAGYSVGNPKAGHAYIDRLRYAKALEKIPVNRISDSSKPVPAPAPEPPKGTDVVEKTTVPVKSSWLSKINWTQAIFPAVTWAGTWFMGLPLEVQVGMLGGSQLLQSVVTIALRTWFSPNVLAPSVSQQKPYR